MFSKKFQSKKAGFTLVELMVVITIATLMMTTLIVQQRTWSDKLSVDSQTYELALMIRQAQIYSLGVKGDTAATSDNFDVGYGVFINKLNNDRYIFFADLNKDGKYTSGEEIETVVLNNGVTIYKFCGIRIGNEICSNLGLLSQMTVSFFRPEVNAITGFYSSTGNAISGFVAPATIYLRSANGKETSIKIQENGQVSITQ